MILFVLSRGGQVGPAAERGEIFRGVGDAHGHIGAECLRSVVLPAVLIKVQTRFADFDDRGA